MTRNQTSHLSAWLSLVILAFGCSGNDAALTPPAVVAPTPLSTPPPLPFRDAGNWTPFSFIGWQPGRGAALPLDVLVKGAVDADDLCVRDIYDQWGARACKGFVVSVPAAGWFHAFLHWDSTAPGFDRELAGEVVLVASTGRFATSPWRVIEPEVFARVTPGSYDVLVMSYSQVRLPFELRAELRPE
jgi:hypothetical protein